MKSSALTHIFLTLSLLGYTHGVQGQETRQPKTELVEAVVKATAYVADHRIDTTGMFIQRVFAFHDVRDGSKSGWLVTWAPTNPYTLDGELAVYVYDNGHVESPGE